MSVDDAPITQPSSSEFDKIDAMQSIAIYQQLTQGKVILKNTYNELQDRMEESALYTLIFNHFTHFFNLYQHIGYKLEFHNEGSFYYVKELTEDESEEADSNAFKIQVILLLIGRYFSRTGRNLTLLVDPNVGLNEHDIEALAKDEESSAILRTAQLKGWKEALLFLVKRHFAFKTSPTSLFLSDAGYVFLVRLIDEYENK